MALNTVARVMKGADRIFQSIRVDRMRSSPIRFGVGGMPRLDMHERVHHSVSNGVTNLNPRVIDKVRVFFRS